jgi:DNA-binding LytR/AlgR family response regulator
LKILILEDELPAANRLRKMLVELRPEIEILDALESVEMSLNWLITNELPDLILMDIQLADGLSLELFSQTNIACPVIFTTAYNDFAIQAFRLEATDYLLKPLKKEELAEALARVEKRLQPQTINEKIKANFAPQRITIKVGNTLKIIDFHEVAYYFSEEKITFAVLPTGKRYAIDFPLDKLETMLASDTFFRLNRQYIAQRSAIVQIQTHTKSRFKITLQPTVNQDIIISTERASVFKKWLVE